MNKNISSDDIIGFLKDKRIYHSDNNISNVINDVSDLKNNSSKSIVFIKKISYDLSSIKSRVILAPVKFKEQSNEKSIIYSTNPQLAMVYLIQNFFMSKTINLISKKTSINRSTKLGKNTNIGDYVVIGENCIIGDNTFIHPGCVICPNTIIGRNVVINSGVKIGQEGFGFIKDLDGNYIQFPHIGRVIIHDNVEIGSNTCIDRGALSDTIIGENTKIDNLCHIAHNVKIGKNCLITATAEINGSTSVGNNVYIGPNASIIDGISIEDNAVIGMGAIVRKDVKESSTIVPFESVDKRTFVKRLKFLKGKST